MPGGGKSCNGVMKTGKLSKDGLITYSRRKRARAVLDEFMRESLDDAYEHDVFPRIGSHWRKTLEYMLHLPGVVEGGGIRSCILDALDSRIPSLNMKTKMEVSVAVLQSEDQWLPTLRTLVGKINETFSQNFQEMAVAGEMNTMWIMISTAYL